MPQTQISLKSNFEFAENRTSLSKGMPGNLVMTIATQNNPKEAEKLLSDFETTLGYGALPAVRAQMIEAISDANGQKRPLSLILEYRV